jgi:hypothetical protein
VSTLAAACPSAIIYVDAAHGGWLGWENNMQVFAQELSSLGIAQFLRGFSTNVANYQPIGVQCPQVGYCLNGKQRTKGNDEKKGKEKKMEKKEKKRHHL